MQATWTDGSFHTLNVWNKLFKKNKIQNIRRTRYLQPYYDPHSGVWDTYKKLRHYNTPYIQPHVSQNKSCVAMAIINPAMDPDLFTVPCHRADLTKKR